MTNTEVNKDKIFYDGKLLGVNNDQDLKTIKKCKDLLGIKDNENITGFFCTRGSIFPEKEPEPLTERQKLIEELKKVSKPHYHYDPKTEI